MAGANLEIRDTCCTLNIRQLRGWLWEEGKRTFGRTKGRVNDCTMTEMEEAGLRTGWDREFCFGPVKCQLFLRLPGDAKWAAECVSSAKKGGHHQHIVGI